MTGPTIMFLVLITVATSLDVLADSSCVDEGNCEAETSLCSQAISVFRKDDVFARKEMEKCVEKINGGDHNGAGLLDIQKGMFRLLGGSAYRVFRISYAADFHKHERAEDYPYLLSNYVKFVRVVMNVYKGLEVIPKSDHKSLDELALLLEGMETDLRKRGCGGPASESLLGDTATSVPETQHDSEGFTHCADCVGAETGYLDRVEQVLLDPQRKGESTASFQSRPHCTVPIRFWYESFMPKLLEVCSIGAPGNQETHSEATLNKWFKSKKKCLDRGMAGDVLAWWDECPTKVKLSIKRAWRLVKHYMQGPQKQRERGADSNADHRSTGDLSRYVPFLDVYLQRSYVENRGMRVTFPYFIGPSTWSWHHIVAERAADPKLSSESQTALVNAFKEYLPLLASVYPCPYCRHHFNEFVSVNKEIHMYPMEFVVLGLERAHAHNRSHTFAFDDKLSYVTDGPSLRLFVWKLHNAVSASIHRSEYWYSEANSITTSRYWPNLHAEIYRGQMGSGVVSAKRLMRIVEVVEVAAKLEALRKKYVTTVEVASGKEDGHEGTGGHDSVARKISDVEGLLKEAKGLVRELDKIMVKNGLLQESYSYHASKVEKESSVDDGGEMCGTSIKSMCRNMHFTVR